MLDRLHQWSNAPRGTRTHVAWVKTMNAYPTTPEERFNDLIIFNDLIVQ